MLRFCKVLGQYYEAILHNNFKLPNSKGFDGNIITSKAHKNHSYLREALKLGNGTIKLDTDTLIDTMFAHKSNWFMNKADRNTVLSAFLFNRQVTVVSPESFFDCGDLKCPDCGEALKFTEIVKSVRLVHGITYEDEIVLPVRILAQRNMLLIRQRKGSWSCYRQLSRRSIGFVRTSSRQERPFLI